jgi:hypothetical protein
MGERVFGQCFTETPTPVGWTWITVDLILVVRAGSNLPSTEDFVWGNAD